jgi:hypothetical protein
MKITLRLLLPIIGIGIACAAAPAEARNYDCSKAGNANKTACKGAVVPASPRKAPAVTSAKAPASRNYDCSKAGNANKVACKSAVAVAPAASTAPAERHYDCTKAGNANKAACRGATASVAPTPAPAARPMPAPTHATVSASKPIAANGPSGATAQCKDGTYSRSQNRAGTCSHHGGVGTWY